MAAGNTLVATFDDRIKADRAATTLASLGIRNDQVSLLVTDDGRGYHFEISDEQTKAAEGVGYGAVLGGLIAGLAAAAIPGSIFIAGPIAAALAAGASGGAMGGLIGGLIGMGMAEDEARLVEEDLGRGDIAIAVHGIDSDLKDDVKAALKEAGAKRVH